MPNTITSDPGTDKEKHGGTGSDLGSTAFRMFLHVSCERKSPSLTPSASDKQAQAGSLIASECQYVRPTSPEVEHKYYHPPL